MSLDDNLGIAGHDASMDDYEKEKLGGSGMEMEDDGDSDGRKRKYRMTSALTANDLEANAGRTPSFMVSLMSNNYIAHPERLPCSSFYFRRASGDVQQLQLQWSS